MCARMLARGCDRRTRRASPSAARVFIASKRSATSDLVARARARRVGSDSNGVDELHHHRHGPDRRRVADAHGRATIVTNVETEFKNHSTLGRGRRRGDGEDERKNLGDTAVGKAMKEMRDEAMKKKD